MLGLQDRNKETEEWREHKELMKEIGMKDGPRRRRRDEGRNKKKKKKQTNKQIIIIKI